MGHTETNSSQSSVSDTKYGASEKSSRQKIYFVTWKQLTQGQTGLFGVGTLVQEISLRIAYSPCSSFFNPNDLTRVWEGGEK